MEILYRRIFSYGSLQFCGHVEEFLVSHTADLLVYIVQPRVGATHNLIRRYRRGALVEESRVRSSRNIFLYYFLWYVNHVKILLSFCPKDEETVVFGGHPIVYFGMGLFRRLRPLRYSYWIGDYFPSGHPIIRLFERLKKWYNNRVDFTFYLTDAINRVMNGTVINTPVRKTVMWGLKPYPAAQPPAASPFSLLVVGLIRPGQGIEQLFGYLQRHADCRLSIIGDCQPAFFCELQRLLDQSCIKDRVFFPNRFYSEAELLEVARFCHVGLALYDTAGENFTHYADPGKVKAYAEMHLPVVMTRISDIVPYVERFASGEVIDSVEELDGALERVRADYARYQKGIEQFLAYFDYEAYYRDAFRALENT